MRLCDRWSLTNRLLLAAHGWHRFFAWCPRARLLHMTNSGWFFLCGFGLSPTTDFWYVWLSADRRRFLGQQIIRKPDFRLLRMEMIPRRRFLSAGFLYPLGMGATALLLWRWYRFVLRPLRFWSGAYILRVLTWRIFCQRRGWRLTRLLWRDEWRWRGFPCGLLDINAAGLLLWCRCWFALRLSRF